MNKSENINLIRKISTGILLFFNLLIGIQVCTVMILKIDLISFFIRSSFVKTIFLVVLGISAIVCSVILAVKTFRR